MTRFPDGDSRARHAPARRRALRGLAALSCGVALGARSAVLTPWSGDEPPALPAHDLTGRPLRLADFRGRVLVVNFWATWCAPCVEEMPSLQLLRARLRPEGLEVVAINHQESLARVEAFVTRLGLDFPVARDHDGRHAAAWRVRVWPTSFVIDALQRIAYKVVGEIDWGAADVESRLRALLPRHRPAAAAAAT